jgi:hypothetical protein
MAFNFVNMSQEDYAILETPLTTPQLSTGNTQHTHHPASFQFSGYIAATPLQDTQSPTVQVANSQLQPNTQNTQNSIPQLSIQQNPTLSRIQLPAQEHMRNTSIEQMVREAINRLHDPEHQNPTEETNYGTQFSIGSMEIDSGNRDTNSTQYTNIDLCDEPFEALQLLNDHFTNPFEDYETDYGSFLDKVPSQVLQDIAKKCAHSPDNMYVMEEEEKDLNRKLLSESIHAVKTVTKSTNNEKNTQPNPTKKEKFTLRKFMNDANEIDEEN